MAIRVNQFVCFYIFGVVLLHFRTLQGHSIFFPAMGLYSGCFFFKQKNSKIDHVWSTYNVLVIFLGVYYASMRVWVWLKRMCFGRGLASSIGMSHC